MGEYVCGYIDVRVHVGERERVSGSKREIEGVYSCVCLHTHELGSLRKRERERRKMEWFLTFTIVCQNKMEISEYLSNLAFIHLNLFLVSNESFMQ